MKKVIVVLLITVLVAGFAFAGTFTGLAGIDFGVDFDAHEWGFDNYTWGQYTFKFEFDSAKVSIGADHQTDLWAELEANASAFISLAPAANNPSQNLIPPAADSYTANLQAKYKAQITKANIHIGEDLTIGILNAGSAPDFASSYYKVYLAANNNKVRSAVAATGSAPGFNVTYKDWKGGFGAEGDWNEEGSEDDEYKIFAHIKTPTFKFADDAVSVVAGAYAFVTDKNTFVDNINATTGAPKLYTNFGGGFKAAYAIDTISADLATDVKYMIIPETAVTEKKSTFLFEAAANAELNFVENLPITVNVYATPGALFTWDGSNAKYVDDYSESLKLDAKVAAGYTIDINDDIALDVSAYAEVRDALIPAMTLEIGASEGTTIDAITVKLSETVAFDNLANKDLDTEIGLTVDAYVEYAHEKFTAYGDLVAALAFDKNDATDTFTGLYFEAGISSDAIIEGATLSLVYGDNSQPFRAIPSASWVDFLDLEHHKGSVTASCVIYF
ncbi:MAG: hypothetical protein IJ663_05310 [Spirochaetales bacterium]|nr:hypothetical protein [Spirochaetales bacterium]